MTVDTLVALLWKYKILLLVCTLGAGLLALGVTFLIAPKYDAESAVALVTSTVDVNFDPRFKTTTEADTTANLVDQAARRKSLATIASSPEIANAVSKQFGEQLPAEVRAPEELLRSINARNDGDLIRISARENSPEQAALVANTWAQVFAARVNEIYGNGPLSSSALQVQADAAKKTYAQAEEALVNYLTANPSNAYNRELQEKNQSLNDARAIANRLDRVLVDAQALRERLASNTSGGSVGNALAKLVLEANSFSTATNLPLATAGNNNSNGAVTLQLQLNEQQLNADPARELGEIDALINTTTARRDRLRSGDVTALEQQVNQLDAKLEALAAQQRELTQARDLAWSTYTTLATKVAEVTVSEQAKGNVVRVAIMAMPSAVPSETRRGLYVALAGLAGFALGLGIAFYLEYAKQKLSTQIQS